jgi:hypothetical protein
MNDEPTAGAKRAGRRSRAAFDPVASARAVAEIQAEGLRAAGELLDRVLGAEPDAGPGPPRRPPGGEATALVDAWLDLVRRMVDALARPDAPGAITVAVDGSGVGPQVRLDGAPTEVWLHNGTPRAVGPLALRCGPLTGPDGAALDGARVRFDPAEIDVLPGRSSRGVVVALDVGAEQAPGVYRGTIQARGAPRLWLPLEVVVEPC